MADCVNCDQDRLVVRWSVWYADGTVKRGTAGWRSLPKDGVTHVTLEYEGGGGRVMSGADWYFRADGENDAIYGYSLAAPDEHRYPGCVALRGKWADDATYAYIDRAVNEEIRGL